MKRSLLVDEVHVHKAYISLIENIQKDRQRECAFISGICNILTKHLTSLG